ncbi:coiled-coil domain-containing protein 9 [Ornithorhynchus anatinus]|uniref:Coiled-coil domain containing 9 n=1 Tax=Ornithorhynchus anatinus TaxID=9258 RepID=A0A6I8P572_ORNAN|nr:coiled-coil domain-containing protein 9 [Ornithorhynchus anatinus]XP_028921077.1 coiled-coil domain-containing protein 9 [Ornithorhynchus anatinus]
MSATLDLRSKEEKDAELDKRIEALRKKNEALIRRYQEIEEDRKQAEREGIAVTGPRKNRPAEADVERRRSEKENFSVTVEEKSTAAERRTLAPPRPSGSQKGGHSPPQKGGGGGSRAGTYASSHLARGERGCRDGAGGDEPGQGERAGGRGRRGRGRAAALGAGDAVVTGGPDRRSKEWEERRRQNIEKMNEEMEKIAEYERNQRDGLREKNPVRNFLDDPRRNGPLQEPDRDRRQGSRRHGRNWGGADFDRVRSGLERQQERHGRRAGPRSGVGGDITLSMTGRERAEYVRWKQEREQIDQERLQRHRKPTGQWRREWDAEKTDGMFQDASAPAPEPTGRQDVASARPPKPPTFGEFLSEHQATSSHRRKQRARARGPSKVSYSHHDDRWEQEEEGQEEKPAPPEPSGAEEETAALGRGPEAKDPGPSETPNSHLAPSPSPEEDEDQWEDVSEDGEEEEEVEEEEEEEEERSGEDSVEEEQEEEEEEQEEEEEGGEGDGGSHCSQTQLPSPSPSPSPGPSPGPSSGPSPSPQSQGTKPPSPQSQGAKPSSPFSPATGYQPVSDWGEEMELNSPRSSVGDSPPEAPRPALSTPSDVLAAPDEGH